MTSLVIRKVLLLLCFLLLALQPSFTGATFFDMDEESMDDESTFMQVGISKTKPAPRRTGRTAVKEEPEDFDEEELEGTAFFQESIKMTGVDERDEEFESDEFSM
ncbi:unnamed protein product [Polarella glacialis]|uniref:Uncharacterized protein n=1 Tax=Polarella glacialis TaxID=89957 RepID=A0A813G2K9_POLGL|nr:unnamed protein product [Polarella glacialis]|eukprot:CAMPEP_0115153366 /NCGR_PEP_ID=MMETSP0227-20121206/66686_1 /TAXON_ID=89957 /ORGANISM="Polarella glacialis, Strain CCMP 1383" /LENGTH=104 /DNA_ID=CAMNT_0002564097 /DNA_START=110 /DNA_END=424 /DNA_ORIENTATION=+